MSRQSDAAPVARHHVFVLQDGTCVIQWDKSQVQDLYTGALLPFEDRFYGRAISDQELGHLQAAGHVAGFDRSYVWLNALPEGRRFVQYHTREQSSAARVREYYLSTTLPAAALDMVHQELRMLGLDSLYAAREQGQVVAVVNRDGRTFRRLAEAEAALSTLLAADPQLLARTAVAFIDSGESSTAPIDPGDTVELVDMQGLIASQADRTAGRGKLIIGIDRDEGFLHQVAALATQFGAEFVAVQSGQEALTIIEDREPDLVIMNLVMPDGHAWQLLGRMRANQSLMDIPVIIVSAFDESANQVFALAVAKAHDYFEKPVPAAELRRSIWTALTRRGKSSLQP